MMMIYSLSSELPEITLVEELNCPFAAVTL